MMLERHAEEYYDRSHPAVAQVMPPQFDTRVLFELNTGTITMELQLSPVTLQWQYALTTSDGFIRLGEPQSITRGAAAYLLKTFKFQRYTRCSWCGGPPAEGDPIRDWMIEPPTHPSPCEAQPMHDSCAHEAAVSYAM